MFDKRYTPSELKSTNLFKPLKLSDAITLEHRGVLPPLTRFRTTKGHILNQTTDYTKEEDWKNFIAEASNKTGDKTRGLVEEYYHQRSQKKGTLVILEGTLVSLKDGGSEFTPGIFNATQLESLSKVTKAIRDNGSFSIVQIVSFGRQADPELLKKDGYQYLSSSAIYMSKNDIKNTKEKAFASGNLLKACTLEDIAQLKKEFMSAAKNAFAAGADGVEVHAANGYMLNQFLDKKLNQRDDQYGSQTFENRARLVLEIFDEIAAEFGGSKVSIRFSPFNTMGDMSGIENKEDTYAFYSYLYKQLEDRRLLSKGPLYISLVEPRSDEVTEEEANELSNEFIFENFKGFVVRAGNILLDKDYFKKVINQNDRTLIAFGRYFISNPDLIERLEQEWPINEYDRSTFYTQTYKGYVDYPYYKKDD